MGLKAVSVSRMSFYFLYRYVVAVSFTWYAMQGAHYYATFHNMGGNLAGGRAAGGRII